MELIRIKIGKKEYSIEEAQEIYGNLKKLFDKEKIMYEYVPFEVEVMAGSEPYSSKDNINQSIQFFTSPDIWL